MNAKHVAAAFLLLFIQAGIMHAETTGTIDMSTQGNISPSTGLYGNVAPAACTTNSECFSYKCFLDFDGTSEAGKPGWCNQTVITRCYHNGAGYAAGTYYCRTNTTYHICDSGGNGTWGSQTSCSSGQTCTTDSTSASNPCAAPSTVSSSGSGSSSGAAASLKNSIGLVSGISDFEIVQGETAFKTARFRNIGNLTLSNVTFVLSGINSSWYGINPEKFSRITVNKEDQFNISIFIPDDADVRTYQASAQIKTHTAEASTVFSFSIRVAPSNQTAQTDILPKYSTLLSAFQDTEQNITALSSRGIDEGNITAIRNIAEAVKAKLSKANEALEKKDYFSASSLLKEAEGLQSELASMIAAAKPPEKPQGLDIVFISAAAFAVIIVIFVVYLLWPAK